MLVLISTLTAVAALFGWLSARVLKLPNTIGTMLLAALTSLGLVFAAPVWPRLHRDVLGLIQQVNFERLILHGMLPLLLFAGAALLDIGALKRQKLAICLLALIGTILSVVSVGALTYYGARLIGYEVPLIQALLFGALISPTDPIAVLEMLHRVETPDYLEAQLGGESLFNDGAGAVIFLALLGAIRGHMPTLGHLALTMIIAAGCGMVLGVALAYVTSLLMRSVNNPVVDILLTLALAFGGYAISERFNISAPLETVTAALFLRVLTERQPAEKIAHEELRHFWSVLDQIQNAILFVLLGCGFLVVSFQKRAVALGAIEIVTVNLVRIASVGAVLLLLRVLQPKQPSSVAVLSWGGLRGGLSIALALTVPAGYGGGWILTVTYVIVVFSILVQGSTMGMFLRSRKFPDDAAPPEVSA